MIKIEKLYSEPEIFAPINFNYGLNIIMGDKSEFDEKKIGVGKSICIEFINYCLLKSFSDSRISLIPNNIFPKETIIKLDLIINEINLTISRSISDHQNIDITKGQELINFTDEEDASNYISNLYYKDSKVETHLSFRNLIAPLIRDERSEFKDIIKTYDTKRNIPRDYKPHLYFLNLNIDLYNSIRKTIDDLDKKNNFLSETKKLLTDNNRIKVTDAKAKLNDVESEVTKLNLAIDNLKSQESFNILQERLVKLESELDSLRIKQKTLKFEIKQIESLPDHESINREEIGILFNQFKSGLGDLVEKSLNDVYQFKQKIDNFKNTILSNKLTSLKAELYSQNELVRKLDDEYSKHLALIDNGEVLKSLKSSFSIYTEKNREFQNLKHLIETFDSTEREKKALTQKKSQLIADFDTDLFDNSIKITSFKNTLLVIHEKIMGSKEPHFEIKTIDKSLNKEFIEFVLRTDDDGSHTTERIKVFIYDIALMINEYTTKRHPHFLIHDNLFDKDDETLKNSLNFLYHTFLNSPNEYQYILTLNNDLTESLEKNKKLDFKIEDVKIASFTKQNRFISYVPKYNEVPKNKL